jgi:hypothetical protein
MLKFDITNIFFLYYFTLGDLKAENLLLDEHGNIKVAGIYYFQRFFEITKHLDVLLRR